MEYRTIGQTSIEVSEIAMGLWGVSGGDVWGDQAEQDAIDAIHAAIDEGVTFFDTAEGYGDGYSEELLGKALETRNRDDLVIATKVSAGNLRPEDLQSACERSLERLNTDYVDVYYIHRWDDDTPIRETLRTLTELVREGKVHHLAASSMAAWKLTKALWTSDVEGLERFEVTQPRFNAADYPEDYLDVCADQGLAVCPYSPLDGGFLTGKYERDRAPQGSRAELNDWDMEFSDRQWRVLDAVRTVADEVDATPAQVSLRWLIEQPRFTCVPIFGARSVEQLEENVAAAEISLSDEQFDRIADAYHDD